MENDAFTIPAVYKDSYLTITWRYRLRWSHMSDDISLVAMVHMKLQCDQCYCHGDRISPLCPAGSDYIVGC